MRKLSKRKIIAATGILGATAAIAVPAAIVYTTKDVSTKAAIGKNVEREIEDEVLGSLKLMPANQFGTFDNQRIATHEASLEKLQDKVMELTNEFNIRVKTRMPIYGIINDVLTASQRFDTWEEFIKQINLVIKALNSNNYDGLSEALFDTKNNGQHKLLSESYGIKRSEIDQKDFDIKDHLSTSKSNEEKERINYGVKHSFVSFGEYVDLIKDPTTKNKDDYITTITAALAMMTGTSIKKSGTWSITDLIANKPTNSIVYMAESLKNAVDTPSKNLGKIWDQEIVGAWTQRYKAIDQFFNMNHQPIGPNGDFNSKEETDVYKMYENIYSNSAANGGLMKSIETFLDGEVLHGTKPSTITDGEWEGIEGRNLTNWEFIRVLFGKTFENVISKTAVAPATTVPAPAPAGAKTAITTTKLGWDYAMTTYKAADIDGLGAPIYFKQALESIFTATDSKISKFVKRKVGSDLKETTEKVGILDALVNDRDFQASYDALSVARKAYSDNLEDIKNDSFRIGIKLDDFKKMIASFKLNSNWNIKIDSLMPKTINHYNLEDLSSQIKYNEDGSLVQETDDYVADGEYIYPTAWEWLLRSSDSISVRGLEFKDGAKLKQFESEMKEIRIFKPEFAIDQKEIGAKISIKWNAIGTELKGGSDD